MLYTFTLSQIMDVVMNVDNANDFTNNLNMMLNMSASCYKIFIAWLSYKNIATLINCLTEEPFKPLDSGEMEIRRQYDKTIRFARMVNKSFTQIIGFQFMASTMVTCSNLYQLTKSTLNADHFSLIMYTTCMLTQIFIYCWFGNKVKLKSLQLTDSIFQMEWPFVENSTKKGILIIMKRAIIPVEISTIYILTINLDSFVTLLKTSYSVYNVLVQVHEYMLYFFSMWQFMDIVLNVDNPDDFTDNLNMMLTSSASCYKLFIVWINYEKIAALINCLTEEPFKPLNSDEMKIRRQYDKIIRNNTLRYSSLIGTTVSFIALLSLFTDFRHKRLTYREWVPYNYSSYMTYCLTYAQQMISTFHTASVNVACDALLCGLLMHICCQIEILEYRLSNILSNQFSLGYCVRHHNRILEYAQLVNIRFTKIVGFQFMASTMVICCNLYQLTKSALSPSHVPLIMYTSCMLTQIFIYCWFGNKVKSKSLQLTNSIFQMEWPILDNSTKKSLLIIMKRAMIPIEISTVYILTINLDSFVALLKTSYSVYNLLVRVQE
ncbi:PREDICTED: odorant receptor 94b-like [Wasmannia auropunctata]|uniref:odorant receptor 94b-like n=1 Tax=Wasmannia auropunctata TaxID=64793 RepID=UPI0005F04BFB|nr:PREDICTED: odorant receptor 94b-like [Wasmannia auropunctata]